MAREKKNSSSADMILIAAKYYNVICTLVR